MSKLASINVTPELWRQRAQEAREAANGLHDLEARRSLLDIAESYERLASRAEARRSSLRDALPAVDNDSERKTG
jgi:hypothetical protein